jgi:hypothetical protein
MCMLQQHRGGALCPVPNAVKVGVFFCTRGAMQSYDVIFFSRVGKNPR